jgi:tetratricopeptide (TPR) repeat protein
MFLMLMLVLATLLLVPSGVEGLVPSGVDAQQPETLSLLGEPLYPPKLPKAARAAADAELQRAHAAYTAKPSGVDEILALHRAHLALGRLGDALIVLTHGIGANPDAPALYLERGRGYILIRKFEVAQRDLTKAAKLPEARCALGLAQYLAADYARARTSYADCADPGVFGYLADRRAGGAAGKPPVAKGPMPAASPPPTFPGAVTTQKTAAPQPIAGSYLDAIERLLAADEAGARERLKQIVEKNRRDWMEPAYIAAEADYARLEKGRKKK